MWRRHVCYVCKRSVCGGDEPQPVAHLSHKLQCARQSLKIMVSYGNKYPRHNARPHVVEQSGQCARALMNVRFPKESDSVEMTYPTGELIDTFVQVFHESHHAKSRGPFTRTITNIRDTVKVSVHDNMHSHSGYLHAYKRFLVDARTYMKACRLCWIHSNEWFIRKLISTQGCLMGSCLKTGQHFNF